MSAHLSEGDLLEGKYSIVRRIGEGGMGVVYDAEHTGLGINVAIKVLHPTESDDPQMIARFKVEATSSAKIRHRNIVEVNDFGLTPDRRPFFVMELLKGESLADRLDREDVLQERIAVEITDQILSGLKVAHGFGIVHRDLKPENVFLSKDHDGREVVKILDFGIAKIIAGPHGEPSGKWSRPLTQQGFVMGTPGYMSPESISGQGSIDSRSDLFSVGVLLYEMLTGRRPFSGETAHDVLVNTLSKPVPRPSAIRPVSDVMERLVLTSLARNPSDRFQTADEFMSHLTAAAVGRTPDRARPCRTRVGMPSIMPPDPLGRRRPKPVTPPTYEIPDDLSDRPAARRAAARRPDAQTEPRDQRPAPQSREAPLTSTRPPIVISPLWILLVAALAGAFYYYFIYQDPIDVPQWDDGARRSIPSPGAKRRAAFLVEDQGSAAVPGDDLPEAPDVPDTVTIWIDVVPRNAAVLWGGIPMSERPLIVPGRKEPVEVILTSPGYREARIEIVPDREQTLKVRLDKKRRKKRRRRD